MELRVAAVLVALSEQHELMYRALAVGAARSAWRATGTVRWWRRVRRPALRLRLRLAPRLLGGGPRVRPGLPAHALHRRCHGALAALVGEDEGDPEDVADEPGDAAGGTNEHLAGLRGDEVGRRGGGGETVVEHGVDERGVGLGGEPDGEVIAAVEVEAGEAVELVEDLVAEGLGVVEERAPRSGRIRCPSQAGFGAQVSPENARRSSNPEVRPASSVRRRQSLIDPFDISVDAEKRTQPASSHTSGPKATISKATAITVTGRRMCSCRRQKMVVSGGR